jgi:putative oxidoreductase
MIPERFAPYVYPAFRLAFGVLFLFHGLQKFGLLGTPMVPLMSRLGAAAAIELVCGALIAAGAFTKPAALIASGEMAFAYFLQHAPRGTLPIKNGGVLAVLYCFAFLYIASRGGGRLGFGRR